MRSVYRPFIADMYRLTTSNGNCSCTIHTVQLPLLVVNLYTSVIKGLYESLP